MPIPTNITDLSPTASSNSPSGNENPIEGDNHLRTAYAFIRQIYDGSTGIAYPTLANLASTADAAVGSGLSGFLYSLLYAVSTAGWGIRTAAQSYNFLRSVPVAEWAAIADGTSTYDVTTLLNTAISTYKDVFLPPGVYTVNPDTGIQFVHGMNLHGAGMSKTVINLTSQGGTTAELAAYTKGSGLRRTFNVAPGTNAYIQNVRIADLAVIMNHPTNSVTTTEIQIGIDMRNVTRSRIERVHVGNIVPLGCVLAKADPTSGYECQGYGVVFGNVSSGASSYAGGEVHLMKDCAVWGAFKAVVQDDSTLSPSSAAHGVRIINCDIQTAHHILAQESQFTTGVVWEGNVLQNVKKQNGNVTDAYLLRIAGYGNRAVGGYNEAGSGANYLVRFDSASKGNHVEIDSMSATNSATVWSDAGTNNFARMKRDTGTIVGGYDGLGSFVEYFNRARLDIWLKFHWDGGAIVIDGGDGATVSRTGAGDYTITWSIAFRSDDYALSALLDTDGAGTPGTFAVRSHGTTNVRINTFTQNGATTTQIDPAFVWIRASQR